MSALAQGLIEKLQLLPHPEGGHFRETYRSAAGTAIYYLLQRGEISQWHRVGCDEMWHFYGGDGLHLRTITPEGVYEDITLSPDLPQALVPAHHWQAARPLGDYALVGCTVNPPFTWDSFEIRDPAYLREKFPAIAPQL